MKINLIFILAIITCFLIFQPTYAQTWTQLTNQVNDNESKVKNIENIIEDIRSRIDDTKENYKLLYDGAKDQNNQLSFQISFLSCLMAAFSIFLTVIGSFFAWYINHQYKKIKEIKNDVAETQEYINQNNKKLYEEIKRDETISLIERLKDVPEDVANIAQLLFFKELKEEDFINLKDAYLKYLEIETEEKETYLSLLLQHFPYLSLKDNGLRKDIISNIDYTMFDAMFQRDIKHFFDDSFKYLEEFEINSDDSQNIIKKSFYQYYKSKFKMNIELNDYIKDLIKKYKLTSDKIYDIAKTAASSETAYIAWLNPILNK